MVLLLNTTNVWLSLSSTGTRMRFDVIGKYAKKKDQLLRASSSVGRYHSTRVDEGRKSWILLAVKIKARAEVGREEEGPLCDPRSELLLGGSARVVRG